MTKNALKLAKTLNSKTFFLISSTSIYRNFQSEKYNERSRVIGIDPYSKSKIMSEEICSNFCKKHKIKFTVLRIGNIYNGNEKKKWSRNNVSLVQQWLNSLKKNTVLKTSSFENIRDWTYAKDIPRAINSIIKNNNNFKILNLVSPYLIKDINLMKKICSNKNLLVSGNKNPINNATVSIYKSRLKFYNWTSPQRGINLIKNNEKN
jgi:nucleoside-diphosphate-sugar epimerase